MRLVIARCSVDYVGRLKAHLPLATRLLLVKADGSVLVHSDGGSYKPLNWMSPPASLRVSTPDEVDVEVGVVEQWTVQSAKTDDRLIINIHEQLHDTSHELGQDPGLIKDGVEADLQRLLADQIELLGTGFSLIRREYFTAIGPVDILARDADGATVAIELKRRGTSTASSSSPGTSNCSTGTRCWPRSGNLRRPADQAAGQGPRQGPRNRLRDPGLRRHARR